MTSEQDFKTYINNIIDNNSNICTIQLYGIIPEHDFAFADGYVVDISTTPDTILHKLYALHKTDGTNIQHYEITNYNPDFKK